MSPAFRISIGANIALAGVVAVLCYRDPPPAPSPAATSAQSTHRPSETANAPAFATDESHTDSATLKLTPAVVGQLEQMGLSRNVLVSALLEDFHRRWDERSAELERSYAPRPVPEREYVELARQRDAEQVRALKEALGEDGYLAWDKEQTLRGLNPAGLRLTADEAEQAYRLQKEFEQQHRELQMAMEDGVADMADASTLQAQAQAALEQELQKLLGEQRLNQMRGIADPAAEVYRKFGDLSPTPAQAHAALLAERDHQAREAALMKRLGENPVSAAHLAAELKALNDAREDRLRRIFGAEAYEHAQRQNDPTFKTLQQFAATWALREDEIRSVHANLHALQEEADRTRSAAALREAAGQEVNWREVDAAIEQVRRQTEASLQALIGDERLRRLKQNGLLTRR